MPRTTSNNIKTIPINVPPEHIRLIFTQKQAQCNRTLAVCLLALKEHHRLNESHLEASTEYFVEQTRCTAKSINKAQALLKSLNLWN